MLTFLLKDGGHMHCRIIQKFSEPSGYLLDLMLQVKSKGGELYQGPDRVLK